MGHKRVFLTSRTPCQGALRVMCRMQFPCLKLTHFWQLQKIKNFPYHMHELFLRRACLLLEIERDLVRKFSNPQPSRRIDWSISESNQTISILSRRLDLRLELQFIYFSYWADYRDQALWDCHQRKAKGFSPVFPGLLGVNKCPSRSFHRKCHRILQLCHYAKPSISYAHIIFALNKQGVKERTLF